MGVFSENAIIGASAAGVSYDIEKSCRFYRGWLTKTFASAGNLDKYTVSVWMKNNGGIASSVYGNNSILYAQNDLNDKTQIWSHGASGPAFQNMIAGGLSGGILGNYQKLRDPASWYHYVFIWDSGNATSGDRMQIWKNGVRLDGFSANSVDETYPAQNQDSIGINQAFEHGIGLYRSEGGSQYYNECYFAEYYFLDGQALDASSFGEFDAVNQWVPIEAKDDLTFGSNGFFLEFKNAAALGEDTSGNNNDFAVNSIDANDQMLDTPTNNWCTWNSIDHYSLNTLGTVSEGNLKIVDDINHIAYRTTIGQSSGKWYWEVLMLNIGNANSCDTGIVKSNSWGASSGSMPTDGSLNAWTYRANGDKTVGDGGGVSSYGATYAAGDIISFALDLDAGTMICYKNDVSQGTLATGLSNTFSPLVSEGNSDVSFNLIANFGQDSSFAGEKTSQGNQDDNAIGDFYYDVPAGYLALCTNNLPTPSIAKPGEHFNPVAYAGTGATSQAQTVGFQPDFVWIKSRTEAGQNNMLVDSVRTASHFLISDTTASNQAMGPTNFQSFDSNGFTVGSDGMNGSSGNNFISWNWKAGGSGVTNTDGNISGTVTVSANPTAGFSIVKWTGSGATNTVGHGLSAAPELIIAKNYTTATQNWGVGATPVYSGWTGRAGELNDAGAKSASSAYWNDTPPTASVFTVSTEDNVNKSTASIIAYCFHSVEGYSKVGNYLGNGDNNGAFVYTGFRPVWVMAKCSDQSGSWLMTDSVRFPYNVTEDPLFANESSAETNSSTYAIDILSNGFKCRGVNNNTNNSSGDSYVYLAFAESPFKTSNAR